LKQAIKEVEENEADAENIMKKFDEEWNKFVDFSWCSHWDGKKYDIVFYGVSGYSGYLMMEYMKRFALKNKPDLSFAIAGRNAEKVTEMRDREFHQTQWQATPVITADFEDLVSVIDLVKSAHVIVNCAGPYMLTQGEILIDACIFCKTDYVDISQEIPWSLRIQELHKYARDAGVMVIPSAQGTAYADIGVFLLAKKIREDFGESTRSAVCFCRGGGNLGGDANGVVKTRTLLQAYDDRQAFEDPFAMGGFIPSFDRFGVKKINIQYGTGKVTLQVREEDLDEHLSKVQWDPKDEVWYGPHANAYFDTRVVRRSNMLQADLANQPYSSELNFMEYSLLVGREVEYAKDTPQNDDWMIQSYSEADGGGPKLEDVSDSWTGFFLRAESEQGRTVKCSFVGADGYFETARVAVEVALTLRFDREKLPFKGGVLTPSAAGGTSLVERLVASGVKLEVDSWQDYNAPKPPKCEA